MRQSVRRLIRSPGFAALAIGMLTVGVGVNAAMVAVIDALLFRPPFQVADPASVVRVQFQLDGPDGAGQTDRTHYPNVADLAASGAFESIAAYRDTSVSVGRGADAAVATAMLVSRAFFDVLRPAPHLGHLSVADTDTEAGDRVVVSFAFWQGRFAGDPHALGAPLVLDGRTYVIGGVAPAGFQSLNERPVDLWLSLDHGTSTGTARNGWREDRDREWLFVVARLRPDRTAAAAEQQAGAILRNRRIALAEKEGAIGITTTSVVPGRDGDRTLEGRVSLWLAGVSALVLLMACANVANLVNARMFAQRRDAFIRLTLGASAADLARRSLVDILLIVLPGTLGALGVSFLLRNAVAAFLSNDLPLARDFWDVRSLGITAASAATAFACVGVVSVLQLRAAIFEVRLLAGAGAAASGKRSRRALLAIQACLCLVLLFVAGLFAMSLRRVEALDLGVDLERTVQVGFRSVRFSPETGALLTRAREVLAAHPAVEMAALAEASPFMSGMGIGPWTAERSRSSLWADRESAYRSVVGPGFFSAVGARSLRGRDFTDGDRAGSPPVAIINAPLAAYLWPSGDALGECIWLDDDDRGCVRVVGVLHGVWKMNALDRERMAVYLPIAQVAGTFPGALYVRARGNPRALLPQLRSIVQSLRPDLPAASVVIMRDVVAPQFRPWQLGASVFSAFAAVALLIASIGLYSVVAVTTALRTKEIGIRMALGARWAHIVRTTVSEGTASVAAGLIVGAVVVAFASRRLGGVLFETSPGDPVVLLQIAGVLLVVSVAAMIVPALRALRTNPAEVLRSE